MPRGAASQAKTLFPSHLKQTDTKTSVHVPQGNGIATQSFDHLFLITTE